MSLMVVPPAAASHLYARVTLDDKILTLVRDGYKGDVARGRELAWDLMVYLVHGRNLARAARELYMHRNTLLGRMNLLEEWMGVRFCMLGAADVLETEIACMEALRQADGPGLVRTA